MSKLCFISQSDASQLYNTVLFPHQFKTPGSQSPFHSKIIFFLFVLQQNCYYLSSKKHLGNCGPQVGNFPSLAQCLYCSARNAVVVLTLQWLGRTLLWSTTWSQTPSDMPCRVPPTVSLRDWRQSEMYNKICLKMAWEEVLWRINLKSTAGHLRTCDISMI